MSGRIRSIKPEWLDDERLAECSSEARVLSIGLLLEADDHGNGRAWVTGLAGRVFPGKPREVLAKALEELRAIRYVLLYEVDGQHYFSIRNWSKHQKVDHPGRPKVPPPSAGSLEEKPLLSKPRETLSNVPETLAPDQEGKGTDRKGEEGESRGDAPPAPAAGAAPKTKRRALMDIGSWAGPTDKHHALARELRVNLDREVTAMRDWAEAKGERKASWDAALNGWLRRAAEKNPPPGAVQHQGFRNMAPVSIPSFDGFATAQRIRAEQETENQRRQEAARALRLANDGK